MSVSLPLSLSASLSPVRARSLHISLPPFLSQLSLSLPLQPCLSLYLTRSFSLTPLCLPVCPLAQSQKWIGELHAAHSFLQHAPSSLGYASGAGIFSHSHTHFLSLSFSVARLLSIFDHLTHTHTHTPARLREGGREGQRERERETASQREKERARGRHRERYLHSYVCACMDVCVCAWL